MTIVDDVANMRKQMPAKPKSKGRRYVPQSRKLDKSPKAQGLGGGGGVALTVVITYCIMAVTENTQK